MRLKHLYKPGVEGEVEDEVSATMRCCRDSESISENIVDKTWDFRFAATRTEV